MKKSLLSSLAVLATTTALLTVTAPSASADDTVVTFALAGGSLNVAVQPTAVWGNKGGSGTTSVVGQLGTTTVTDTRGGTTGWSVGAARTAVGDGTTTATAVSYNSGLPTTTGVVTALSAGATTLTATPAAVMSATVVVGNNTATWNPTLTVTLPASSTAGDYSGSVTTSLL